MKNNIEAAHGFLTAWLVNGPTYGEMNVSPDEIPTNGIDDRLRHLISDEPCPLAENIHLGGIYAGEPWRYWHSASNIFVDLSKFYFHLCTVRFYAFTQIEAAEAVDETLCLWCYPATDVWVNGQQVISHEAAIYKPMRRMEASVHLNKGKNDIFVQCQNLGVRDTRNIFGIQIKGQLSGLNNILPDPDGKVSELNAAAAWLNGLKWNGKELTAQSAPVGECSVLFDYGNEEKTVAWENGTVLPVDAECEELEAYVSVYGETLNRCFDLIERKKPVYCEPIDDIEQHRKNVMAEQRAKAPVWRPTDDTGIYAYCVFARMVENGGKISEADKDILMHSLQIVDSCSDCADFALTALLRIMLYFPIEDKELRDRMKQVVLDFRYWMDEPGSDAMCYTSENHSFLFHAAQMAAGRMYPNDIFTRTGRTGAEQNRIGNERCKEWLERILNRGYEEFNSAGYMSVTATALLNPIDFGNEEVSDLANKALVKLLDQLSHHAFHGNAMGPMGRTYRDVIIPHRQEMQSLLYLVSPNTPKSHTYFLSAFAKTSFVFPDNLTKIMAEPVSMEYRSGSALISLEKSENYLLSSVVCNSDRFINDDDRGDVGYHASAFAPGVFGYQQHMWYAALNGDCVAFINHPGDSKDKGMVRPGYWFGNSMMPALKQQGRMLGGIHYLDETRHPIFFTHLYWPSYSLEESVIESNWYFGRKGSGYMAIWSSVEGVPFDEVLTGCEYRFYGEHSAFFCVMGSDKEDGSFAEFMQKAKAMSPALSQDGMTLTASNGYSLKYEQQ